MRKFIAGFFFLLTLNACTTVTVSPVDPSVKAKMTYVCIQNNPKVLISDFLTVVRDGFKRHGIETEVFRAAAPASCEYVLTYTAKQNWGIIHSLTHAELTLEKNGKYLASAAYHMRGGGGFDSTKEKLDPVIDELLN